MSAAAWKSWRNRMFLSCICVPNIKLPNHFSEQCRPPNSHDENEYLSPLAVNDCHCLLFPPTKSNYASPALSRIKRMYFEELRFQNSEQGSTCRSAVLHAATAKFPLPSGYSLSTPPPQQRRRLPTFFMSTADFSLDVLTKPTISFAYAHFHTEKWQRKQELTAFCLRFSASGLQKKKLRIGARCLGSLLAVSWSLKIHSALYGFIKVWMSPAASELFDGYCSHF
jgi:hypothetical protein